MHSSTVLAFGLSTISAALAAQQGFNYGASFSDGTARQKSDFQTEFTNAKGLAGTNGGFTSARLYTMIQHGTTSDVTSAIPAALAVPGTKLLLGIWGSGGQTGLDAELVALKSAIATYGTSLAAITEGISVGSEDLYRESPTGIKNLSGVGADAATISNYISQVKQALKGTALGSVPVGHVDTWTAWVNGTNSAAIEASDFIGFDAYPYFQNTFNNPIENAKNLFEEAYDATVAVSQGKPVWITETGWPVSGKTENLAVPSTTNAKTYWDEVGCPRFGNTPVYWYTLQDADSTTPNPSFGVITPASTTPLYDLSCNNKTTSSSASSSSHSSTAVSSGIASATGSGAVASSTGISPGGFGSGNSTSGSGSGSASGPGSGSGSGSSSGFGSGSASGSAGSGVAGSTGNVGPSPTGAASFTGGAIATGGSVLSVVGAMMAVAAFLL